MAENSIAARMQDYFLRQMALFERMASANGELPADLDSPAWEQAQQEQARFAHELETLEEEFRILKREWDAAPDIPADARDQMKELAATVLESAERITRSNARHALHLSSMMEEAKEQHATLLRGKRMLRNLRAGGHGDAGFIDRKA